MRLTLFLTFVALVSVPAGALAGGGSCSGVHHIFEQADQDGDGSLDAAEYDAAGLERYGVTFEQTDLDGDGKTSLAEYIALYEAHHPPAEPPARDTI